jgi:hypothetical protein
MGPGPRAALQSSGWRRFLLIVRFFIIRLCFARQQWWIIDFQFVRFLQFFSWPKLQPAFPQLLFRFFFLQLFGLFIPRTQLQPAFTQLW